MLYNTIGFCDVKGVESIPHLSHDLWSARDVSQQIYVGQDRFAVRDVLFLSVFLVDLLLQYRMGKRGRNV